MTGPASPDRLIAIAIATFRRPRGLLRLLRSLEEQDCTFQPHIVVADNDGRDAEGAETVRQVRDGGYRFPITAITVPERGISQARNALMDYCFGHLGATALAMIDDDERAEPQWIAELVRVQELTGADVVGGPVAAEFESEAPAWVRGQPIYWRQVLPEGPVPIIRGTGNVLLSRSVDVAWAARFDEAFALTGGGDHEFFFRLKRLGAKFAFAPAARTHEWIGASRMRPGWAIHRAYRIGNTDFRVFLLHGLAPVAWMGEGVKISAALLLGPLQFLVYIWHPARRTRALLMMARQAGKISALFGQHPRAYETTHGR
jgi:succinoglycan biosynthesis protein ExoM